MNLKSIKLARFCLSRPVISYVNTSFHCRHYASGFSVVTDQKGRNACRVSNWGSSNWTNNTFALDLTGCSLHQLIIKRCYMRRKTMKILPTKPLSFDYGGDLTTEDCPLDMSKPKLELDGAERLHEVDENIRRLLSVEFGDGNDKQRRRVHDLVSKVKEHPLDVRSLEVVIAYQTVSIRNQMRHVLRFRKDKVAKALLVRRIQARRKHLRRLRKLDHDKFLWLCEELQMKFIPVPEYNRKPSKRAVLKATARNAAIKVKKEKLEQFKQKLKEDKESFLVHKEQELADIEQMLQTLNLDDSSYLGRAMRALKHGDADLMKEKQEPPMSRRRMILLRKFELAEKRAKERESAM